MEIMFGDYDRSNVVIGLYTSIRSIDWLPWLRFRTAMWDRQEYDDYTDSLYYEGRDFGTELTFGWLFFGIEFSLNLSTPGKRRPAK